MKMRSILLTLSALILAAGFAPRVEAQAQGTFTVTIIDSGCITGNTCTLQLSREALAAGVSTCDAAGNSKYSALNVSAIVPQIGAVNTAWSYPDIAIVQGTSYCYTAIVTNESGVVSAASTPLLAAIPAAPPPPAPTVTGNYTPPAGQALLKIQVK